MIYRTFESISQQPAAARKLIVSRTLIRCMHLFDRVREYPERVKEQVALETFRTCISAFGPQELGNRFLTMPTKSFPPRLTLNRKTYEFWLEVEKENQLWLYVTSNPSGSLSDEQNFGFSHPARSSEKIEKELTWDANFSFLERKTPKKLLAKRLWRDKEAGDTAINELKDLYNFIWADERPEWFFWRDWLQGLFDGKPKDEVVQSKVASIPNETWKVGPKAVAAEIARIETECLLEKAPQAERIEFNEDSGKFFAVPIDAAKPDLLGATLSQLQDALEDVLANPGNGIIEASRETRVLRRVFAKYGNDPQQIEMGFVSVHKGLTRQIVLAEDLPASEENLALMDALQEGAKAIRATHPEVAENRKIINEQALRELPEGVKETLQEALPLLEAISDDELADDWQTDIPQLINDATLPLPSGAPPLPGVDESMRIFSRAAKINLIMKASKVVHRLDQSATIKASAIALILYEIVKIGLSVIG